AAQPRLELDLCRPTAGSGLPASDLLELHRPAQPLGAGHDADHAFQLSAVQAGPAAGAATGLSLLDDVLAFPAAAHHLPLRTAVLSLLRPADLHRFRRRVRGLYTDLFLREPRDAELAVRAL